MKHLTRLTKKNKIVAITAVVLLAVSLLLAFQKKHPDDMLPVRLAAIQTIKGWGYEIFVDEKIFIKQEAIPAIGGDKPFRNKEEALTVGNLAVKKIVHGKMPAITMEELKSLKVIE